MLIGFLKAHWRGDFSLARSYWLHGVALSIGLNVGVALLEGPLAEQSLEHLIASMVLIIAVVVLLSAWQTVGIWRSASHSAERTGHRFWPALAKMSILVGCLKAAVDGGTTMTDMVRLSSSLRDPLLAEYTIERRGENNLVFTGAINGSSADDIIDALDDPALTVLRVNSPGGLLEPAIRLARYIHRKGVVVVAEDECISACVMLLAASPDGSIFPDTQVTFHRPESIVRLTNVEMRRQSEQYLAEANKIYSDLGLANWAIETAGRQQFWTPTIFQMIRMGLIVHVYDQAVLDFVPAYQYCTAHVEECT